MKKIMVTPPKTSEHKKLKVAAYCRVSTLSPTFIISANKKKLIYGLQNS